MAQQQFTTYQADVLSFELREAMMGIIRGGRYSGFDQISEDGTPSGGTIFLTLDHSSKGVQTLPEGGSSLSVNYGVAVTTQGIIIREDDTGIDIDIPDNSGGSSFRWYVIYMEHDYDNGTPGPSPATFGTINGVDGGGIPALTEAYHRVIIGYIRANDGAVDISDLTYFPATVFQNFGDENISEMLWGSDADTYLNTLATGTIGVIPSDGVIGNRKYTENNYIVDEESLSDSLNAIDQQVKDNEDDIASIGGRALDDVNWAALSDNTNFDVNQSHHGLMPKCPNDEYLFFDGEGNWTDIRGITDRMNFLTTPTLVADKADLVLIGNTGVLDLSSYIPVGSKSVSIIITAIWNPSEVVSPHYLNFWHGDYTAAIGPGIYMGNTNSHKVQYIKGQQIEIPVNSSREISYTSDDLTDFTSIYIYVVGYVY